MVADSRAAARAHRLRPLNLPRPVLVEVDRDGILRAVRLEGVRHQVVSVRERWRVEDEWWRRPIAREYVEAVLEDGRRVVVFRDLETGAWYRQRG